MANECHQDIGEGELRVDHKYSLSLFVKHYQSLSVLYLELAICRGVNAHLSWPYSLPIIFLGGKTCCAFDCTSTLSSTRGYMNISPCWSDERSI